MLKAFAKATCAILVPSMMAELEGYLETQHVAISWWGSYLSSSRCKVHHHLEIQSRATGNTEFRWNPTTTVEMHVSLRSFADGYLWMASNDA